MLGLLLIAASFALAQPSAFRPELTPLTKHLLQGSRPVLAATIQTTFWVLCVQLAMLISWYRAQCKLDFGGRYRVWPWAAIFFGVAALCSATNLHVLLGQIVSQGEWLVWRCETVVWLLPACVAGLPLTVLLDRDVRRGRSTLYTLRTAWFLGLAATILELFAPELQEQMWYPTTRLIVPMFFGATLFLGLWLHARVVAFVCPDPPECDEPGATLQLLGAGQWCIQLVSRLMSLLFRKRGPAAASEEAEAKPKRRSRKTVDSEEDSAPKRKRKATTKRATKPRTRVKPVEEEQEEEEETEAEDDSYSDEADESSDAYEMEATSNAETEWEEDEAEVETPPPPAKQRRTINSSTPAISPKKAETPSWQDRPAQSSRNSQPQTTDYDSDSDDDESEDGDSSYRVDSGLTADQLRGLSKRQKRELRQKIKDQQRNQKR